MKKTIRIRFEGKSYDVEVEVLGSNAAASAPVIAAPAPVATAPAPVVAAPAPVATAPAPVAGGNDVPSPMMGLVFKTKVKVGDVVTANQEVMVLEAMKMETPIYAPTAGTVTAIHVKEQDSVSEGQALLSIG